MIGSFHFLQVASMILRIEQFHKIFSVGSAIKFNYFPNLVFDYLSGNPQLFTIGLTDDLTRTSVWIPTSH